MDIVEEIPTVGRGIGVFLMYYMQHPDVQKTKNKKRC